MRKLAAASGALTVLAISPAHAFTSEQLGQLTGGIDAALIVGAIFTVGAVMIGPRLARMAVGWIKAQIK